MLSILTLTTILLLHAAVCCLAEPVSIPLYHNHAALARRSDPFALRKRGAGGADDVPWAAEVREHVRRKYGALGRENGRSLSRRQGLGHMELGDAFDDALYYVPVQVGTPAATYNLIADTGSSDLWVASPSCVTSGACPNSAPAYDPSQSSTSSVTGDAFSIAYGSGRAEGVMVADTLAMGGYSKPDVLFAVANSTQSVLRQNLAVSGIAGFGWSSISTSKTIPFWELLAQAGTLDKGVFAFALTRASGSLAQSRPAPNVGNPVGRMARWLGRRSPANEVDIDLGVPMVGGPQVASTGATSETDAGAGNAVYGGTLTLGGVNETQFQGDINMINLTSKGFWLIPMQGVTVNGASTNIGQVPNVAIDTGTSLIAAPAAACASIFSKIPGSTPSDESAFQGYWEFPCNSTVEIALEFNGESYPMDAKDFNLGQVSSGRCLGSVFELDLASTNDTEKPSWIVGAAWLKNVYSIYQLEPPAVGFAQLAETWKEKNGAGNETPTTAGSTDGQTTMAESAAPSSLSWEWAGPLAAAAVSLLLA